MNKLLLILSLCLFTIVSTAQQNRIKIVHADNSTIDEEKFPGATILLGNVYIEHEGIFLRSKKAIFYKKDNFLKAFGSVFINQGDTITQTSKYVDYNGNTKTALSWGNVVLKDPIMTLTTDSLRFNRVKQKLYYRSGATIKDTTNILESKIGNYYLKTNKFEALSDVVLTNPDYVLESNDLVYYTNTGKAHLNGASTITGKDNFIYTEKGFYDTKADISHFTKNSRLEYKNRQIIADSLYYDRTLNFASATQNIQMKDTTNNSIIRGHYGEFYQKLDSAFVVNRAVAITAIEKDSMYIHGDTLLITGKSDSRVIRAYHNVKFFKSNLSGKCDSLHSNQATGLTQLFKKPVLWAENSQITGDTIHLISNTGTEKLDSLKVLQNVFIIQKDSTGFNQIKGRDLFGKFIDNDLSDVHIIGNGENIFFLRNDETKELIGIDKTKCSEIKFKFEEKQIKEFIQIGSPEGDIFPLTEFPENVRKFKGFIWREDERPLTKDDIFKIDAPSIDKESKDGKPIKKKEKKLKPSISDKKPQKKLDKLINRKKFN